MRPSLPGVTGVSTRPALSLQPFPASPGVSDTSKATINHQRGWSWFAVSLAESRVQRLREGGSLGRASPSEWVLVAALWMFRFGLCCPHTTELRCCRKAFDRDDRMCRHRGYVSATVQSQLWRHCCQRVWRVAFEEQRPPEHALNGHGLLTRTLLELQGLQRSRWPGCLRNGYRLP